MQQTNRWLIGLLAVGALALLACSDTSTPKTKVAPAKVETVQGSKLGKVTLVEAAVKRLDLKTAPVREEAVGLRGEPGPRKMVPYSAIIYDLTGSAWVYTNPEPLAYLRAPVTIDYIDGNTAVLFAGPSTGTLIVSVGAAELYGAETGVK